jgi:hypothetical protein
MRRHASRHAVAPGLVQELLDTIASGDAILFTGAGFSLGALDLEGQPLPDSEQMRQELWRLLFDDEHPDGSTLQDLYDVALLRAPHQLADYVARRLRVGTAGDSAPIAAWLSLPWRRIYTLNVDDLEVAVQRTVGFPRALTTSRAGGARRVRNGPERDVLEVVHLNGIAADGADALTFSTLQYAARLCGRDRAYAALVHDLMRWPFVFVGTSLDEVVLWQHLELQRRGDHRRASPRRSYLIAPSLSRARQLLLEHLGVVWVEATAERVASWFDAPEIASAAIPAGRGRRQVASS